MSGCDRIRLEVDEETRLLGCANPPGASQETLNKGFDLLTEAGMKDWLEQRHTVRRSATMGLQTANGPVARMTLIPAEFSR